MAKKNRSTLKRYFRKGALPTEDQFNDLIDSTLNTIDEGFDKSPENGFEISVIGDHPRLISFIKSGAASDAVWVIDYDREHDRLLIKKPGSNADLPAAMTFNRDGNVGVNQTDPRHTLDVGGIIAAEGRLGANPDNRKTIAADGHWHSITGALSGCQAFEVMAGVGSKGTGRYALMNALAMNTFNPRGWLFNFLNLKKKIRYQQAYYLFRGNRIKLRWLSEGEHYYLQMRTLCPYGDDVIIRYYLTQLWFDEDMSESWKPKGDAR
ncbi:MAG: hypothetical protein GY935_25360 [Gammaproteobacteria bacterium]|nr:hypothetical protein [Gammaproteobacteria bacterium]